MNREIKFRAWHLEDGMLYFDLDNFIKDYHNQYGNIMLYTSLKDRNGKEIYEGDIDQDGGIVFYNESWAMFMIDYGTGIDIANMEDVGNWMIVSGNIYETPQLLKPCYYSSFQPLLL
jgi:hypothetical protein